MRKSHSKYALAQSIGAREGATCAHLQSGTVPTWFSKWNICACTWTHFPRAIISSPWRHPLNKVNLVRVDDVGVMVKHNWTFGDGPSVPIWEENLILSHNYTAKGKLFRQWVYTQKRFWWCGWVGPVIKWQGRTCCINAEYAQMRN
jgi:hypothetical protein